MELVLQTRLVVRLQEQWIDLDALAGLLAALGQGGSLAAAANDQGLSYRGAWGKLAEAEALLGRPLAIKSKGHGSRLTDSGKALVALVNAAGQRVGASGATACRDAEVSLRALFAPAEERRRLVCSHDILLQDCAAQGLLPFLDMRFAGSAKAVEALKARRAELAGFHLPEGLPVDGPLADFLQDRRWFALPLMRREQGLIVARGNPLRIRGIEDLVKPGVRFINRQKGAGTRLWLDQLLKARGIDARAIQGYRQEEFTHFAVAAAVAAGAADVAFGVRAATEGLALDFLPVGHEIYYLGGAAHLRHGAAVERLVAAVADALPRYSGYSPPDTD